MRSLPQKGKVRLTRLLFIAFGIACITDTVVIYAVSNMLLGVVLPLVIGLPLLIYGVFYYRLKNWMKKGPGRLVRYAFIAGYAAYFALIAVCSVFIQGAVKPAPGKADALIILGAGIRNDQATIELKSRLKTAAAYLKENPGCIAVVSGGQSRESDVTQASVMADYLAERGVSRDRILEETRADSTYENFLFSKELLDRALKKPYSVVYVTNEYHIYRAGLAAASAGLTAHGLASPSQWYLYPNHFLRESLAILKTWIFGYRGWISSL
jgi:uncharacterized SAM-binding protein YcdF (DUF218 family)